VADLAFGRLWFQQGVVNIAGHLGGGKRNYWYITGGGLGVQHLLRPFANEGC
jgi:hypothetical protein